MKAVIIYASDGDRLFVDKIAAALKQWGIKYEKHLASAHKVPEKVLEILEKNNQLQEQICYITVAGRSNALSGLVAANSIFPVLACPPLENLDEIAVNINSSLMMPSDTPALTVLEPINAAAAIARIFGLFDKELFKKVRDRIKEVKAKF